MLSICMVGAWASATTSSRSIALKSRGKQSMGAPEVKPGVSAENGALISSEAASWMGTPYALVGNNSTKGETGGGDCSGTTCKIFAAAGFLYDYQATATFPTYAMRTGLFRELDPGESKQSGDLLYWSDHMAIYSTFMSASEAGFKTTPRTNKKGQPWTQYNDMWTASHPGGSAYRASAILYSGKPTAPRIFRWVGAT